MEVVWLWESYKCVGVKKYKWRMRLEVFGLFVFIGNIRMICYLFGSWGDGRGR